MNTMELDFLKSGAEKIQLELTGGQLDRFTALHDMLKKWSAKINLTAFKSDIDLVRFLYLDSLALAKFIAPDSFWLDIGTGAGFPGIPCKIVRPNTKAVLIDKNQKKITFVKETIRQLNLENIEALKQDADIETFRNVLAGTFDLVVSRALSEPAFAFDICFRYVRPGGMLCLMLTESQSKDLDVLFGLAEENNFSRGEQFEYSFEGFKESRLVLQLIRD